MVHEAGRTLHNSKSLGSACCAAALLPIPEGVPRNTPDAAAEHKHPAYKPFASSATAVPEGASVFETGQRAPFTTAAEPMNNGNGLPAGVVNGAV